MPRGCIADSSANAEWRGRRPPVRLRSIEQLDEFADLPGRMTDREEG
jgi:hypothetical protein